MNRHDGAMNGNSRPRNGHDDTKGTMGTRGTTMTDGEARAMHPLADARAMVTALRGLRETMPERLSRRVRDALTGADRFASMPSVFGPILVAWSERGITAIEPAWREPGFEERYASEFGRPVARGDEVPAVLRRRVEGRLAGRRADVPVDLSGLTDFERAVLLKALEIPSGEVRPYGWIAREIGHPKAVRAVGSALARNPIPLVLPCHRVVRSDGRIGNYGWGREHKIAFLEHEGVDTRELERLASRGVRYVGSATTGIFCMPTCRHARRISEPHRRLYRSAAEAQGAGMRPCRVCRPAAAAA